MVPYSPVGRKGNHGSGEGGREARIGDIATAQHGVVSLDQLRDSDLTASGAASRARRGALHRRHRGVYAVGHRSIGRIGELQAALLACGESAVVSHGTAAALWGLQDRWPALIDITVSCQTGRKIDGVRCRRCRYPTVDEIAVREGVTRTTPARTLVDNAGLLGTPSLRRMVERAAVLKLLDLHALRIALARAKGRRGIKALQLILEDWLTEDDSVADLRSDFEALVLPRLLARGLPRPVCNKRLVVDGHRIVPDFYGRNSVS